MHTTNAPTAITGRILRGGAVGAAAFCLLAGSAYAATTISANVATTGTLTVDGTVALGNGVSTAAVDSSNWDVTAGGGATFVTVAGNGSALTALTAANISAGTAAIDISGNAATSTALSANGANCAAGSAPLGVDASGAVEGCTAYLAPNGDGSALTGLTKGQVGLGNVVNLDTSTTANITDSADKRFVSDAQLTVIGNTSGTNTGNQDLSGLLVKASNLSDLTSALTARTNLGLVIGTDVLAPNGNGSALTALTAANISAGTAAIDISGNAATSTALFANGANCGAGSAPLGVDASGAVEGCTAYLGSALLDGKIFVGNGANVATAVTMSGDATISNTGVVTVTQNAYAMFYGLTAGTGMAGTDYAGTIAVGAAVPFPQDGPASGGVVSTTDMTFTIPAIGTYEVTFHVHTTEPGQLQLAVDNGVGFVVAHECTGENFNPTSGGHPIVGSCVITTTNANAVVKIINPAGNSTALTITPADGANTHANSQTLVIKQL